MILRSLLLLIVGIGCSTTHEMADNQKSEGHYRLYTYPDKIQESNFDKSRFKKIVIASTNDLAGNLKPHTYQIPNRFEEQRSISIGGINGIKTYVNLLKKHFDNSVLYVDSGSRYHKTQSHLQTDFYYNYLNVDAVALGTAELNLHHQRLSFKGYIEYLAAKSNFAILASNIFDLKNAEPIKWRGVSEFTIKEINSVKVGIISVLSQKEALKAQAKNINGLYIQNQAQNIIEKSKILKRKGANIIIAMTNSNIDCVSQIAQKYNVAPDKVNFDPTEFNICLEYENELSQTLKKLPPNTIDLVITSGSNLKTANFVQGIPVMQNPGQGKYLSWIELMYDEKHNTIVKSQTRIRQPIQLCHQFFKETQDCFIENDIKDREIIPAKFLGHPVQTTDIPAQN